MHRNLKYRHGHTGPTCCLGDETGTRVFLETEATDCQNHGQFGHISEKRAASVTTESVWRVCKCTSAQRERLNLAAFCFFSLVRVLWRADFFFAEPSRWRCAASWTMHENGTSKWKGSFISLMALNLNFAHCQWDWVGNALNADTSLWTSGF